MKKGRLKRVPANCICVVFSVFNNAAAKALVASIKYHRLAWRDGPLGLIERYVAYAIFQRCDGAGLIRLAVTCLGRAV